MPSLSHTVLLALLPVLAAASPVDRRQLSGLGSGSSSLGGLGDLGSLGGLGGSSSGTGSTSGGLGGLGSLGGLGGSSGSSGSTGGLGDLGSLGGLGSGSTGSIPGLGSLGGAKRQLSGLSGLGSGTSGLGSLGGLGSSSGSTGSSTGGLGGLGSLGGLGGSSGSSGSTGGLGSLGGLGGSSGSIPGLGGLGGDSTTPTIPLPTPGLTARQLGGSTQNGLSGECKAVILIFARGTSEMGNMGSVVGPGLYSALEKQIGTGKVAAQGVDYAASAAGNMQMGDPAGSKTMASLITQAFTKCPNAKVVISGYSQGAMLAHNAAKQVGAEASKIAAAVAFGDPFKGQAFEGVDASKCKVFCKTDDTVCGVANIGGGLGGSSSGGVSIVGGTGGHLSYGNDVDAAAQFVASVIGTA